ncbi:uncharacterized protein LOC135844482 isoform X2 [Planococcus citri]|uniref:uncharacterized protein LOC135844482 isoform X2 n=1 Tax=Planococcus citri TaxID=170843 RepID=UPI0031F8C2FD
MKWGNDLPNNRQNNLSMKHRNSKYYRYVRGASILCIFLTLTIGECLGKESDEQTIQPPNESWKEEKTTASVSEPSDIILRNYTHSKIKDNDIAFMNKPSKFDEHVEDDQYVDNPLLLLGLANSTQSSANVTIIKDSTSTSSSYKLKDSANGTFTATPQNNNYTTCTNETSTRNSSSTATTICASASGTTVVKNLTGTDAATHLKLIDVDSSNENLHSALVRKRNSADISTSSKPTLNDSAELPNNELVLKAGSRQPANIYYKNNIYGKLYDYKNVTRNFPSLSQLNFLRKDNAGSSNKSSTPLNAYVVDAFKSYPRYQHVNYSSNRVNGVVPKIYHKSYFNDANNLFSFKLKKETEDYRMLEKRIRRRNSRVRRSLNMYSLPFNEVIYRRPYRRYRLRNNDRMDIWDHISDHNRRYVRFPLPADASPFRPSRPLNAVAAPPPPPPPPPPPSSLSWTPPQLPQYAAYHQALPTVPSMGPRSPRLVFRDPIEPGTLQAPFSPNGLQDLTAPEDNKGCGVSVAKQQTAQRRIVGGDEAGFGSFPWQAYIRIGSSRCGGTLVNRYHVVTAGHCVARATARQVQVTLGDYVINSAVEPLPAYTFGVRKINVHPYFKFTPQADRFDVAVLRLDRPVQYMPHIAPICLPEKDEDFLGQYGWAAGWGALQAGSRLRPKTLQAVDVPIIDNRQCERWHKSNGINVVIYEEMMCAGYRGGSKDSCQGDSGGPLMLEKTGRWYLIGIVSAGYSCAQRGQPGIYHRVAHTVDWISYIVNS